ncbi:MAG: hypothetical protein HC820_01460 [Hydrococcus sp. RM1_1_31]|nr:hypothetical protein [Hydrococcus sp. RM1_1_31]
MNIFKRLYRFYLEFVPDYFGEKFFGKTFSKGFVFNVITIFPLWLFISCLDKLVAKLILPVVLLTALCSFIFFSYMLKEDISRKYLYARIGVYTMIIVGSFATKTIVVMGWQDAIFILSLCLLLPWMLILSFDSIN